MASQMKSCRPKTPGGKAAMPESPPPSLCRHLPLCPLPSFLHSPLISSALNTVNVNKVMMGPLVLASPAGSSFQVIHLYTDQSISTQIKAPEHQNMGDFLHIHPFKHHSWFKACCLPRRLIALPAQQCHQEQGLQTRNKEAEMRISTDANMLPVAMLTG